MLPHKIKYYIQDKNKFEVNLAKKLYTLQANTASGGFISYQQVRVQKFIYRPDLFGHSKYNISLQFIILS